MDATLPETFVGRSAIFLKPSFGLRSIFLQPSSRHLLVISWKSDLGFGGVCRPNFNDICLNHHFQKVRTYVLIDSALAGYKFDSAQFERLYVYGFQG